MSDKCVQKLKNDLSWEEKNVVFWKLFQKLGIQLLQTWNKTWKTKTFPSIMTSHNHGGQLIHVSLIKAYYSILTVSDVALKLNRSQLSVGKVVRLSTDWLDTAHPLVFPLRWVALAELYKNHHQSGKLVWKQHYSCAYFKVLLSSKPWNKAIRMWHTSISNKTLL